MIKSLPVGFVPQLYTFLQAKVNYKEELLPRESEDPKLLSD